MRAVNCATVLTFVFSMDDGSGNQGNNGSRLRKKEYFWKKILPCFPTTNPPTAQRLKSPIMNGKVAPQQDVSQVYNGTESFFKVAFEF